MTMKVALIASLFLSAIVAATVSDDTCESRFEQHMKSSSGWWPWQTKNIDAVRLESKTVQNLVDEFLGMPANKECNAKALTKLGNDLVSKQKESFRDEQIAKLEEIATTQRDIITKNTVASGETQSAKQIKANENAQRDLDTAMKEIKELKGKWMSMTKALVVLIGAAVIGSIIFVVMKTRN